VLYTARSGDKGDRQEPDQPHEAGPFTLLHLRSGTCAGPHHFAWPSPPALAGPTGGYCFWRNHPELWDAEFLARIQATDQRFDADHDGALSSSEADAAPVPGGNMDDILKKQLLAAYFNLATRRINAATALSPDDRLVRALGLMNVRDAVVYADETLLLPVTSANRSRYTNATTALDQINANKIEVY
jgi:hypothetical protein